MLAGEEETKRGPTMLEKNKDEELEWSKPVEHNRGVATCQLHPHLTKSEHEQFHLMMMGPGSQFHNGCTDKDRARSK